MSDKDFIKQDGGKEKTDLAAIKEFLNEEAGDIVSKVDKAQAKSIKEMNFKMISDDIQIMDTEEGPYLLVAIAKLDSKYYGAFYDVLRKQGMAEELDVKAGMSASPENIRGSRFISDPTEWSLITEYFQQNHVFEMARIFNWAVSMKANDDAREHVKKLLWYEKVSKDLEAKGRKPLTPDEVAKKVLKSGYYPDLKK